MLDYLPLIIPIMGISLGFFGVWTHHKQKMIRLQIQAAAPKTPGAPDPQQAGQIRELQERVRVLERIVTDGGYDLAHKIEALRDERPLAETTKYAAEAERMS